MSKLQGYANRQVGFLLCGAGAVLTLLGVALFFEKNLLRFGNLMFIAGMPLIIGPGRTAGFFLQPKKARATSCLFVGIFLVFIGRPMFGMALEVFGFLNLFGNLFPLVFMMAKRLPVVGDLLNGGGGGGGGKKRKGKGRRDDSHDSYDSYGGGDSYGDWQDDGDNYNENNYGNTY